ncbi:MAG: universal stress protein [Deltaproteobacteria bacterium]|nr:universal stress protein [Deltaproteobacteria bacterium]
MKVHIKTIVCTTDFSDFSNGAIPFGVALAKEFGAKLYLCHVIDLSSVAMYGEGFSDPLMLENKITDYAHEHLKDLIGDTDIEWESLTSVGHTADEIALVAKEKGADLVVSATHGRSGLKRLILGSVTERLMRTLPCPMYVVRSLEREQASPVMAEMKLKRILVGCDFSADSDLAVQYGLSLAQEFQAELYLAHVLEPSVYRDMLTHSGVGADPRREGLREKLTQKLNGMVPEEAKPWCTPETLLLAGHPSDELTKYALVNEVDLIVLGVRGHSVMESLLVGSTTDRVVRQAPCPVLSVRPKE